MSKVIIIMGSRSDLEHCSKIKSILDNFNIEGLDADLGKNKCEACGAGPMIAVMMISEKLGAINGRVLKYANSGDISGDKSAVVGYMSAVFYKKHGG